jgi:hypothetical protein
MSKTQILSIDRTFLMGLKRPKFGYFQNCTSLRKSTHKLLKLKPSSNIARIKVSKHENLLMKLFSSDLGAGRAGRLPV